MRTGSGPTPASRSSYGHAPHFPEGETEAEHRAVGDGPCLGADRAEMGGWEARLPSVLWWPAGRCDRAQPGVAALGSPLRGLRQTLTGRAREREAESTNSWSRCRVG